MLDTQVFGGTPQPSLTTVAGCQQGCTVNADCVGLDFIITATVKCYFILSASNLNPSNMRMETGLGINHYRLARCEETEPPQRTFVKSSPLFGHAYLYKGFRFAVTNQSKGLVT